MTDKPKKPVKPKAKPSPKPKPKKPVKTRAAHHQVGDTVRGVMDELPTEKNKVGRPTKYNDKLAQEMYEVIATSTCSLMDLCKARDHWPTAQNLHLWVVRYPKFRDLYMEAKRLQAQWLAEETLTIADDDMHDELIDDKGNVRLNSEFIQRSKLRVETRKWHAAKLAPKVWGDAKLVEDEQAKNEELREKVFRLQAELEEKHKKDY